MPSVFFSYSHADEALRDALQMHLAGLRRNGVITTWHDRGIVPGQDWVKEIDHHVNQDEIILALVSASFLNSNYCYEIEMTAALARHDRGEAVVIPVILRPCDWHSSPLGRLQALPKDAKPITTWTNQDEAFLDVVNGVKRAIDARAAKAESIGAVKPAKVLKSAPDAADATPSAKSAGPRSSNLGIARRFTDAERDRFLEESFDFMARYFENSLIELQERRPEIEVRFRRIDANTFTAAVYVNGRDETHCRIAHGDRNSFTGGIAYSTDLTGNSFNESMSVEHDGTTMFLKPFGMRMDGGREDARLSQEGAAEYYWSMLIEPLQRYR